MKSFVAVLICLSFLVSCSKNENNAQFLNRENPIDKELLNVIENSENNVAIQKLSFRTLTSNEKEALWKIQIDYYLSSELNDNQKDVLRKLKDFISSETFESRYSPDILKNFSDKWTGEAKKFFSSDLIRTIVSEIHTKEYCEDYVIASKNPANPRSVTLSAQSQAAMVSPNVVVPDCACSTSSDYCGSYALCSSTWRSCTSTSGCGFLWLYTCNGLCKGGA